MGGKGPPPTPTKVLEMRGSWRAKINPREPQPEPGKPNKPQWLGKYAASCWKQLIPKLNAIGILTKVDRNALSRYCVLWGRWKKAEEFLEENGTTQEAFNKDGDSMGLKAYPQVKEAQQLASELLRLEQHFGLTPSARARLQVPEKKDDPGKDNRKYLQLG